MDLYEEERVKGLRKDGRIHSYRKGGTACGLGRVQFTSLKGTHFHSNDSHVPTCEACQNVINDHDPECGWASDWSSCFCKITIDAFPIILEWEVHDSLPAGSICEGRDLYDSFRDIKSHVESEINHFMKKGHRGVKMRFKVDDKMLRL